MTLWEQDTARPHDRDFIFHSWLSSYRDSPRTHDWAREAYDAFMQREVERLLERSTVFVARPEGWPQGVYGWACAEQTEDAFVLHYGFVKRRVRTRGIFWGLVEALKPRGALLFTHLRPPYTRTLSKRGFVHAPERA